MAVTFEQTTLDNGLTIIGEVNASAHTAAAGFFVKTGTRDEPIELMGVSHFLEHMMFKGTSRRTAAEVNIDFDRIGAQYNAFTHQETTAYWAHVLPHFLPDALDILADILRPALREDDFTMEKNVILEEIGMYADRPFWVAYEHAMERHFDGHPLAYRILGTPQSIDALTAEQMRDYFAHRYCPDNITLALAGRVDFDRCVDQIASLCGSWKPTGAQRDYRATAPTDHIDNLTDPKLTRHYLVGIANGPSRQDERRYAGLVLSQLLGDADGSRLYWELIDPGLADEAEVTLHPFDHAGTFLIYASCSPAQAERVEEILLRTLDTAGERLTEEEITRVKHKLETDLTLEQERPAGRMMALGNGWLYTGEYRPMAEELAKLEAVDADALAELLSEFPFTPRTLVRLTHP